MRKLSKLMSVLLAAVLTFGLISCGTSGDNGTNPAPTKLTVKFKEDSLTLNEWDTAKIGVTVSDGSAVDVKVDDPTVAYLRGSTLTALKAGETTLTAVAKKDESVTAKMTLKVNEKPENRPALAISGQDALAIGAKFNYSAVLGKVDASAYSVTWSVDNKKIAAVSKSGELTAKSSGTVKLTATAVYCTVEFKAEKSIEISQEVKVVFAPGATETKLAVSAIKAVSGECSVEIAGKTYTVDADGNITLIKDDFDVTQGNSFAGKVIEGENVHEFKLIVYKLETPKAYQNGTALKADENGYFKVDTSKPADNNGLRWVTFDSAETMAEVGYDQLKLTLKFDEFCPLFSGMVHESIGSYHYSFGYKYTEKGTNDLVWLFWDNNYGGKAYGGAMKPAYGAPYGYGYVKIYDASGKLLLDYYNKTIEDASGTHGNWSDYISPLETGKEYVFVFDIAKTGDLSFSGIDGAVITKIEWSKKLETKLEFPASEISVDEWVETNLTATVNDGSKITYSVDKDDVLYLKGDKIIGLKAGVANVTATANGKTATLKVTVNAKAENRPELKINVPAEIEIPNTATVTSSLKCGDNEVAESDYTVAIESSNTEVLTVANGLLAPIKKGEAEITATATYCGQTFTATAKVSVKDAPAPVDNSIGKLYQGGKELTPDGKGAYVMDAENETKTLTLDPFALKQALGYKKVRLTVKFSAFSDKNVELPYAGECAFGYTFGDTKVGWWNDYTDQGKKVAYAGAFYDGNGPWAHAYLKVYNIDGEKIFEHYENYDNEGHDGWSSSFFKYIPSLAVDTEYIFEIDTEKTGDITLYGFENATITKIKWLDMKDTTVSFKQETYTAEEWEEFTVSAVTNDGSDVTYSIVDGDDVLFVAGNKVIGVKAGESKIIATANGKTAEARIVINANADNKPVLTVNENSEIKINESLNVETLLKIKEKTVASADYVINLAAENANVGISGLSVTGVTAGTSKITVTVTYCDVDFKAEFTVTVKAEAENPNLGKLYNNGKELTVVEDGENKYYKLDKTTATADSNGIYWLTLNKEKAENYSYFRFKVKFSAFADTARKMTSALYSYSFGFKYGVNEFFYDNGYSSGGFGGGLDAGGNATAPCYFNIYDKNGAKTFDYMEKSGWTEYYTLSLDTEYIFEFNVKAAGKDITFGGFENAVISEVVWSETLLG